jgi:hypothetical protein
LEWRWAEACHNAARLWRELVDAGFPGRSSTVRAWATERRRREPAASLPGSLEGQTWQPSSIRRTAHLLLADHKISAGLDAAFIARLLGEAPALRAADAARCIGLCYGGTPKIGSMTSSRTLPPPLSQAS